MIPSKTEILWQELRAKLKQAYGQLTDDDLAFIEGKGEELVARLQQKLGLGREEVERVIDDLERGASEGAGRARRVATQVKERVSQAADTVRDKARAGFDEVRTQTENVYEQGRERVLSFEHEIEDYVREKPFPVLFCALGLGFILGWSARRH
jgi:uncharacterized protein YjbJ (UPF0337 family)